MRTAGLRRSTVMIAVASSALVLSLAHPAHAAHNDDFLPGDVIVGQAGSVSHNNVGATTEPGEPTFGIIGSTVWYHWLALADGPATFNTCVSNYDTTLGAYTGLTVATLVPIAVNDDTFRCGLHGFLGSRITFNAIRGTLYHIQVGGFGGNQGNFTLQWASTSATDEATPAQVAKA